MRKMNSLLKRGLKIVVDSALLKILQSEIRREISNPRFLEADNGSLGEFKLDWDSPVTQDIVLKRQFDSGEEVVISALVQQEPVEETDAVFPQQNKTGLEDVTIPTLVSYKARRLHKVRFLG